MGKEVKQIVPEVGKTYSLHRSFLAAVTAIEVMESMSAILTWIHQCAGKKLFSCFPAGLR